MLKIACLTLGLLFCGPAAPSQTTSTESQTMLALLAEIRQLRHDLQSAASAAMRAQILIYRLHVQAAAVQRASQNLDNARSMLQQMEWQREYTIRQKKEYEEMKDHADNSAERKRFEDLISGLGARIEALIPEEQELRAKESEREQELRIEQAKFDELQDELERLDKALEIAALQGAVQRH
jgi:hypothetical protein